MVVFIRGKDIRENTADAMNRASLNHRTKEPARRQKCFRIHVAEAGRRQRLGGVTVRQPRSVVPVPKAADHTTANRSESVQIYVVGQRPAEVQTSRCNPLNLMCPAKEHVSKASRLHPLQRPENLRNCKLHIRLCPHLFVQCDCEPKIFIIFPPCGIASPTSRDRD